MTDLYVSHFSRKDVPEYADEHFVLYHHHEDPRKIPTRDELIPFAFERFQVVLHEPQFLRYAKKLIANLLLIDPTSILVVDKQSGKISGVWPTDEELRYRIRIDELGIFGMEDGCVVVR